MDPCRSAVEGLLRFCDYKQIIDGQGQASSPRCDPAQRDEGDLVKFTLKVLSAAYPFNQFHLSPSSSNWEQVKEVDEALCQTNGLEGHREVAKTSDAELAWARCVEWYLRAERGQARVVILVGGASGSGKTTTAMLLAERLGISHIIGTDNVRNVLRESRSQKEDPVLWLSTYKSGMEESAAQEGGDYCREKRDREVRATLIRNFELQAGAICDILKHSLLFHDSGKSVIVEGVGLSPRCMVKLSDALRKNNDVPCIVVKFSLQIRQLDVHRRRFALRGKKMVSSDPEHNVYSSHIENIRCIAEYIEEEAGRYNIHQVLSDDPDGPVSTVSALQLKVLQV